MIQRIQTVYLFLVLLVAGVLPFVFPLWKTDGKDFYFASSLTYSSLFGLSATLALLALLFYQKRQHQFVIDRLNIILNLILLGLFLYRSLNLSGEAANVSEKGIGMFLPFISIVLLVLANRAIKKDEDLVKSVDRLR
ncbi:DUF4293 family protein [Flavobacterium silvaticum]|uniref:DUF4293 domain-containing protein n=1 Tax=Flavobacterium silvaticum TaxID=1852020 RepID=A0A972JFL6_9FLAO|nr:DUF4293 family protein [Flavobacterium silvaticum]NMH27311.1 DUF4293 domain-containing protein [Flavobacterium silvaticum]